MSDLATRVRAKYPGVYDDLSDTDLEKAVLAKHPEYADLATKPPESAARTAGAAKPAMADAPTTGQLRGNLIRNAGKDVVDMLGGIPDAVGNIVAHPIDSVTAIPVGMLHRLAAVARDPLGAMYEHPIGTPLDVAGVASGAKALTTAAELPNTIRAARLMKRVDRYMPNTGSVAGPQGGSMQAVGASEAAGPVVDRYMPNKGAASHEPDLTAAADPTLGNARPHVDPSAFVNVDVRGRSGADVGREWHAYGSEAERAAADTVERARIASLHRDAGAMDTRFQQLIHDPRGSVSLGLLMHMPEMLRPAAREALQAVAAKLPGLRSVLNGATDAGVLLREGQPRTAQPNKNALLAALGM